MTDGRKLDYPHRRELSMAGHHAYTLTCEEGRKRHDSEGEIQKIH